MHPMKNAVIVKHTKITESSKNRFTTSIQVCRYPICTITKKSKSVPYRPSLVVKIETSNMSKELFLPKPKESTEQPKPQETIEQPKPQIKVEQLKPKERIGQLKPKKTFSKHRNICPDCMDSKIDSTVKEEAKKIPTYIIDDDD